MLNSTARTDPAFLSAAGFRDLAAERLASVPLEPSGDHEFNPDFREWVIERAVRPAAVLIPVVDRGKALNIVLTKRLDSLRTHSGQIAFPGGRVDDTDVSVEAAALREAHEEVALEPGRVEVLGRLPDYYTGSGFRIAPVVALIDPRAPMTANPLEVDYVFEAPLAFLMDPANHRKSSRQFQGRERFFFEMPYGDHYIWGVTAGILKVMHDRLFA